MVAMYFRAYSTCNLPFMWSPRLHPTSMSFLCDCTAQESYQRRCSAFLARMKKFQSDFPEDFVEAERPRIVRSPRGRISLNVWTLNLTATGIS